MNEINNTVLKTAVSGLAAAVLIDLHAWSKTTGQFDWLLAAKRWLAGAISGMIAGAGL